MPQWFWLLSDQVGGAFHGTVFAKPSSVVSCYHKVNGQGGGWLMSRVCFACGLLCEMVQLGTSLSWQLDFSNFGLGLGVGLLGVIPTVNHLGEIAFNKLTSGNTGPI
jgi:hypothetical protein